MPIQAFRPERFRTYGMLMFQKIKKIALRIARASVKRTMTPFARAACTRLSVSAHAIVKRLVLGIFVAIPLRDILSQDELQDRVLLGI